MAPIEVGRNGDAFWYPTQSTYCCLLCGNRMKKAPEDRPQVCVRCLNHQRKSVGRDYLREFGRDE